MDINRKTKIILRLESSFKLDHFTLMDCLYPTNIEGVVIIARSGIVIF